MTNNNNNGPRTSLPGCPKEEQEDLLPLPVQEIEISGLELLLLGMDYSCDDDDDSDDLSCDSYCADSMPAHRNIQRSAAARAVLHPNTSRRCPTTAPMARAPSAVGCVSLRRASLASQLTEDDSIVSLNFNDSFCSNSHRRHHHNNNASMHHLGNFSGATDDDRSNGAATGNNYYPDFAQDSMNLVSNNAIRTKNLVRSFSQSVLMDSPRKSKMHLNGVGRAA